MSIDGARFQQLLSEASFSQLFNELGWDNANTRPFEVTVGDQEFSLRSVAQKRGVSVLVCSPNRDGVIPERPILLKIEKEAAKISHEHLLIFENEDKSSLTWLWVFRAPGQPHVTRTHNWHRGTSGESLRQKLSQIVWSLDEEEAITLTDVITGLRRAFDRDQVTKSFYTRFKVERETFAKFVDGITADSDRDWYASLMLNRLMFVYFIQRKGFLDNNINYLADKMEDVRRAAGSGHFHTFYREFLRRLFHEGFGLPNSERDIDLGALIGDVPYLNGGLFDVHELEEANPEIDIDDEAFESLFEFFDAFDWHLDDRPLSSGNEINPDVLGYIFEKYVNQKQMGAYYTKEDITEYISKSAVISHLLERSREECRVAFEGGAAVWRLLQIDPSRYIYPATKTGVIDANGRVVPVEDLPESVQDVFEDSERLLQDPTLNSRDAVFFCATGERGTLPNESWREYFGRRTHCLELLAKLEKGDVDDVEKMIQLNADSRQFMQDVIDTCEGPDLLRAVWKSIVGGEFSKAENSTRLGITILDPTCGSGAFLFAALNILEPLYEACLERMESFVEDSRKLGRPADEEFLEILDEVNRHHSRSYYIYKNIILHNLFGVDIMAEAVEICKLRLFLKLVSQIEARRDLEPLPDIDFNIRTGNALIGYATEQEFAAANTLASDQRQGAQIKASLEELATLFDQFRDCQTAENGIVRPPEKRLLRDRLDSLREELDKYLAHDCGVDASDEIALANWQENHQALHWFAEFYSVIKRGGFDVIIGNPPYVEIPKSFDRNLLTSIYKTALPRWSRDEDLYTLVVERSLSVLQSKGKLGFILPLSLAFSTKRSYVELRDVLAAAPGKWWLSHFDRIPSSLFGNEVRTRCTIAIYSSDGESKSVPLMFTSGLTRWNAEERDALFQCIRYSSVSAPISTGIPKIGSEIQAKAYSTLCARGRTLEEDLTNSIPFTALANDAPNFPNNAVFVGGVAYNWFPAWRQIPPTTSADGTPSLPARTAGFRFSNEDDANLVFALLCSSLGYWWWAVASDGFNLKKWLVNRFPISLRSITPECKAELVVLGSKLKDKLESQYVYKDNRGRIGNYYLPACQATVDEIDRCLANHVEGLTKEFFVDIRNFNASFSTSQ